MTKINHLKLPLSGTLGQIIIRQIYVWFKLNLMLRPDCTDLFAYTVLQSIMPPPTAQQVPRTLPVAKVCCSPPAFRMVDGQIAVSE